MNKQQLLQNTRDELSATKLLLRDVKSERNLFIGLAIIFLLSLTYTSINEVSVREDLSTCQEQFNPQERFIIRCNGDFLDQTVFDTFNASGTIPEGTTFNQLKLMFARDFGDNCEVLQ